MREPLELDLDVAVEQLGAIGANEPPGSRAELVDYSQQLPRSPGSALLVPRVKPSVCATTLKTLAADEPRASWPSIVGLRIAKGKRARHLGRDLAVARRALVEQR
jgi:hypothetical protein